jgi:hypothetical protein
MCDNDHDHGVELDLHTVYHEFHDIKHLLEDLNESVGAIAATLKKIEAGKKGVKKVVKKKAR